MSNYRVQCWVSIIENDIERTLNSNYTWSSGGGRLWSAEAVTSSTWPLRGQSRSRCGGGESILKKEKNIQ